MGKGAYNLSLYLNISRFYVLAKITKQDETNIDANTALYSTWRGTQCFARLAFSWTVKVWTTQARSARTTHT